MKEWCYVYRKGIDLRTEYLKNNMYEYVKDNVF